MTYRHHLAGKQAWSRVNALPTPNPTIVAQQRARRQPITRPYQPQPEQGETTMTTDTAPVAQDVLLHDMFSPLRKARELEKAAHERLAAEAAHEQAERDMDDRQKFVKLLADRFSMPNIPIDIDPPVGKWVGPFWHLDDVVKLGAGKSSASEGRVLVLSVSKEDAICHFADNAVDLIDIIETTRRECKMMADTRARRSTPPPPLEPYIVEVVEAYGPSLAPAIAAALNKHAADGYHLDSTVTHLGGGSYLVVMTRLEN